MQTRSISWPTSDEMIQQITDASAADATSAEDFVRSAMEFYLSLSGAARRSARFVLASPREDSKRSMFLNCGRSIAQAGSDAIKARLAEGAESREPDASLRTASTIAEESVRLVRESRERASQKDAASDRR